MLRKNWLAKATDWLAKPTDRHDKPACLAWALMPTQNPSPSQKSQSAQGQASLPSQKVNSHVGSIARRPNTGIRWQEHTILEIGMTSECGWFMRVEGEISY